MPKLTLPRLLIAIGILVLIIGAYHCGSSGKNESIRKLTKEYNDYKKEAETQIALQDQIITASQIREQASQQREQEHMSRIADLQAQRANDAKRYQNERDVLLAGLKTATGEEIAHNMDSAYRAYIGGDLEPLTPEVFISKPTALFHIEMRETVKELKGEIVSYKAEISQKDSIISEHGIQRNEWMIQQAGLKEQIIIKDGLLGQADITINGLKSEAKRFRRQRNGVIIFSVSAIGAISYLVFR